MNPPYHLLDRLELKPYFIELTLAEARRCGSRFPTIAFLRSVETWDHAGPDTKTVISAGNRPIFVKESPAAVRDAVNAVRGRNRS